MKIVGEVSLTPKRRTVPIVKDSEIERVQRCSPVPMGKEVADNETA